MLIADPSVCSSLVRLGFEDAPSEATSDVTLRVKGAFSLSGALDFSALGQSLNQLARGLSMSALSIGGDGDQADAGKASRVVIQNVDLSGLDAEARKAGLTAHARQLAHWQSGSDQGAVLTCTLLRMAESEHVLLVLMPAALAGEASVKVFGGGLALLYDAFASGRAASLPSALVHRQVRPEAPGGALDGQRDLWLRRLSGPPLQLPTDRQPSLERARTWLAFHRASGERPRGVDAAGRGAAHFPPRDIAGRLSGAACPSHLPGGAQRGRAAAARSPGGSARLVHARHGTAVGSGDGAARCDVPAVPRHGPGQLRGRLDPWRPFAGLAGVDQAGLEPPTRPRRCLSSKRRRFPCWGRRDSG